jgi:renalase
MGGRGRPKVAVVGAGMAGLAAAGRLVHHGCTVTLFDKSNGVGGRMATRRVAIQSGTVTFDHGVQFIQPAKSKEFVSLIEACDRAGVASKWADVGTVGTPDMTAIPRHMARGLDIVHGHTISGLYQVGSGWTLEASLQSDNRQSWPGFDATVLAIPAPQVSPILQNSRIVLEGVDTASFHPVWALMIAVDSPLPDVAVASPACDMIAWVADNSSKPGRRNGKETGYCYVVHASAAWSKAHLELNKECVGDLMLQALARRAGAPISPSYMTAHRWRYGLVATPVARPYLWDAQTRVGACGDWCLGHRVEHAFLSGRSLADAVIDALGNSTRGL